MPRLSALALLLTLVACTATVPATGGQGGGSATPEPAVAFVGVDVAPMDAERVLRDQTVVVQGDRIVAVGPASETAVPPGALVIEGRGRTLVPGLWDMHTHIGGEAEASFAQDLAYGVTGVRDMGVWPDTLRAVRQRLVASGAPHPRLVAAGPLLDGPQFVWSHVIAWHLDGPTRVAPALDSLARYRPDFLKVYNSLSAETYGALVAEATRRGLSFAGHVPFAVSAATASRAGQASVEHVGLEVTAAPCIPDGLRRTQAVLGLWFEEGYAGYRAAETALRDEADPACLARLDSTYRANGTRVVPTLVEEIRSLDHVVGTTAGRPVAAATLDACRGALASFGEVPDSVAVAHRQRALGDVARMHRAGVRVLAGSDTQNACVARGAGLHAELALLAEAGFSPFEALAAATTESWAFLRDTGLADALGWPDALGTVAPGQPADLVLLDANPLDDITATRGVAGVLRAGRWLDRPTLDRLLAGAVRSLDARSSEP